MEGLIPIIELLFSPMHGASSRPIDKCDACAVVVAGFTQARARAGGNDGHLVNGLSRDNLATNILDDFTFSALQTFA